MDRRGLSFAVIVTLLLALGYTWRSVSPAAVHTREVIDTPVHRTIFSNPTSGSQITEPEPLAARAPMDTSVLLQGVDEQTLAWVEGTVFEADGRPASEASVVVTGAHDALNIAAVGPDGHFRFAVPVGSSTLQAVRWDGMVKVVSSKEHVILKAGDVNSLTLDLPAHYAGETGLIAIEHQEGFEVAWVVPDSPADRLGLSTGDVILEIGGVAATELDAAAFEATMVGAEGSDVPMRVRFADVEASFEENVDLPRSALDVY